MKKRIISLLTSLMMMVTLVLVLPSDLEVNAYGQIYWPVPGHTRLSQRLHDNNAIDINDSSIEGADVIAACGGTVTHIWLCAETHLNYGDCNGFGTGLVIKGDDGRIYQYAHMQANSIPSNVYHGGYVSAGQKIGKVGSTGYSTGPHLHFGISIGSYINNSGFNPDPNGGTESYIYTSPHTHSYSSTITKQPTCTETGVRTYTCSCGSSYTESIAAKGHSYVNKVVAPTSTEKGYTLHTCSVCGNSYKDSYVNPPQLNADGWYYCDALPSDVSADKYTIQYNNYYEKTQSTSPGSDWTNAGVVKNEWQNSGAEYKSYYDLETSDSRVLVYSAYYHFCIPGAGKNSEGNYELSGNFTHYDAVDPAYVTAKYCGDDAGHPFYLLYWADGNAVYCKSGDTCDGSWGTHDYRCRAWYKENTYQDRVKIELYKFTKNSGWVSTKDSGAQSVKIRYKDKECSHTFSEWTTAKKATCTATGTQTRKCSVCGKTETKIIAKKSHTYKSTLVAPTYAAEGYTLYKCSVCGDSYKDNYTAKKTVATAAISQTYTSTGTSYTLNWSKVSGATGYKVYRYDGKNAKWVLVKTVSGANTLSTTVSGYTPGSVIKFKVNAYVVDNGKTYYGKTNDFLYAAALANAKISSSYTSTGTSYTLNWSKVQGATGYKVYRYDGKNSKWVLAKTVTGADKLSTTVSGFTPGSVIKFKVNAYLTKSGKTYYGKTNTFLYAAALAPTKVNSSYTSTATTAKISWSKVSGATGYKIYKYNSNSNTWTAVKTVTGADTLSTTITGLKSKTTTKIKVNAYIAKGSKTYLGKAGTVLNVKTK